MSKERQRVKKPLLQLRVLKSVQGSLKHKLHKCVHRWLYKELEN